MEWVYDDWCGWAGKQLAMFFEAIANGIGSLFNTEHTIFYLFLNSAKNGFFTERLTGAIQVIAVSLCIMLFAFALFRNFFAAITDEYQSPVALTARFGLGFGFCLFSSPILSLIYSVYKQIYSLIIGVLPASQASVGVTASNANDVANNLVFGWKGGLIALIIKIILIIEFLKLLLELAERYLVIEFGFLLAPLAGAMLTSKSTHKVFVSYIKMMMSSFLLLALNAVFVRATLAAMNSYEQTVQNADNAHYIWIIFLVALMRTGCAIDKYLNNLGLSVAQTGGNLVGEMLGAARDGMLIAGSIPKAFKAGAGAFAKGDKIAGAAMSASKAGTGLKGFMANMAGGGAGGAFAQMAKNFKDNGAADKGAKILAGLDGGPRGPKSGGSGGSTFSAGAVKAMSDAMFKPGTSFGGVQASAAEKNAVQKGVNAVMGDALKAAGVKGQNFRTENGRIFGETPAGGKFSIGDKKLGETDVALTDATGKLRYLHHEGGKPLNLAAMNKADMAKAQGASTQKTQGTKGGLGDISSKKPDPTSPLTGGSGTKGGSSLGDMGQSSARIHRSGSDSTSIPMTEGSGSASLNLNEAFTDDGATAMALGNAINNHYDREYGKNGREDYSGINVSYSDTGIEFTAGPGGESLGVAYFGKVDGGETFTTASGDTYTYFPSNDSAGASSMYTSAVSQLRSSSPDSVADYTSSDGIAHTEISGSAARAFAAQMVSDNWTPNQPNIMNSTNLNTTEFNELERHTGTITRASMDSHGNAHIANADGERYTIQPLDKVSAEVAAKGKVVTFTGGKGIITKDKH